MVRPGSLRGSTGPLSGSFKMESLLASLLTLYLDFCKNYPS